MKATFIFTFVTFFILSSVLEFASAHDCTWLDPIRGAESPRSTLPDAYNLIFVTDGTNFDDVVTLFYLLKSPMVNLVAIYITPNAWASAAPSFRHMKNILFMMGDTLARIPIYIGSQYALIDELEASDGGLLPQYSYRWSIPTDFTGILGSDSLYGQAYFLPESPYHLDLYTDTITDETSLPALATYLSKFPDSARFTVLSTGALTSLAKIFTGDIEPYFKQILARVDSLVIMGGAVRVPGNVFSVPENDKAEFNIYADPHGAHWAMANFSKAGINVRVVPLDAANGVPVTADFFDTLLDHPKTPEAHFVGRILQAIRKNWFNPSSCHSSAYLWDPTAAVILLHPAIISSEESIMMRVVFDQGPRGSQQGFTKECSSSEVDSGVCFRANVIFNVSGDAVRHNIVTMLQSSTNSAKRGTLCPVE